MKDDRDTITATDIGKIIGKSANEVNTLLSKRNVLRKEGDNYVLTQAGREYGIEYHFLSGRFKISNNHYYDNIFDIVLSLKVLEPDKTVGFEPDDYDYDDDDLPF